MDATRISTGNSAWVVESLPVSKAKEEARFELVLAMLSMQERVKLSAGGLILLHQSWHAVARDSPSWGKDMKKLRILIADDHGLVRRGAREVLHSQPRLESSWRAAEWREQYRKARELNRTLQSLISDAELDRVEAVRQIREQFRKPKSLCSRMHESDQMVPPRTWMSELSDTF